MLAPRFGLRAWELSDLDTFFSFFGETFVRMIGNVGPLATLLIGAIAAIAVATLVVRRSRTKRSQYGPAKTFQMSADDGRLPREAMKIESQIEAAGYDERKSPGLTTPVQIIKTPVAPKPAPSGEPMFAMRDERGPEIMASLAGTRSSAQRALATQRGKMVEKIPRRMQVGVREPVEIRLGTPEAQNLRNSLLGAGSVAEHDVDIVETMSVELFSPDGAFKVEGASPIVQLVRRDVLKGTPFAKFAADFGQWIWYVTPQERGKHPLSIRVSASVLDSKGAQANAALPDRMFEIEVSVSLALASSSISKKIATLVASGSVTGIAGAFVGALTKDFWWPMVAPFFK